MNRLVEIRAYQLKPGTAAEFHDVVTNVAVPMLRESGMDVVAYGPSQHDPDAYFLIRAYDDLEQLNVQQAAFYGSQAWREGPREPVVSRIQTYLSTVLWLSPQSIDDVRRSNGGA
jgi:quinol monooxygenase YgiN